MLYEFEAKKILKNFGIQVPKEFGVFKKVDALGGISYPAIAKVQILQGKRQKAGGVAKIDSNEQALVFANKQFSTTYGKEKPYAVLVEEAMETGKDIYVSIVYEPTGPMLIINMEGGVDVEESPQSLIRIPIDIVGRTLVGDIPKHVDKKVIISLLKCFFDNDCRQIEINPLRIFPNGNACALDVKMILDDRAFFRHEFDLIPKNQLKSEREKKVDAINQNPDYTGSPCRYVELEGNVSTLLSGGGASLVIFDALVSAGLKPGNYSEYSGNPNKEKVEELAQVVLSKPGQKGLLIAGGVANFTMIDKTMQGVASALSKVKPDYPVVIRRGGPGEHIARKIIEDLAKTHALDITWFGSDTPISKACSYFIDKVKK